MMQLHNRADVSGSIPDNLRTLHGVTPPPDAERRLRDARLRVTRPRVAVLDAVHLHPHADTDTIIGAVRGGLGEV